MKEMTQEQALFLIRLHTRYGKLEPLDVRQDLNGNDVIFMFVTREDGEPKIISVDDDYHHKFSIWIADGDDPDAEYWELFGEFLKNNS